MKIKKKKAGFSSIDNPTIDVEKMINFSPAYIVTYGVKTVGIEK